MTPGEIVGDVIEYARETPVAEFIRNLACDVREKPAARLPTGMGSRSRLRANRRIRETDMDDIRAGDAGTLDRDVNMRSGTVTKRDGSENRARAIRRKSGWWGR